MYEMMDLLTAGDPQGNDLNHMRNIMIKDFIKFTRLAKQRKCLPDTFRFDVYLNLAAKMLDHIFTIEDAQKRYTRECEYSPLPSLRRHARHIYGYSYTKKLVAKFMDMGYDEPNQECTEEINRMLDINDYTNSSDELFEEIGGKELWVRFMNKLEVRKFIPVYGRPKGSISWNDYEITVEQIQETLNGKTTYRANLEK